MTKHRLNGVEINDKRRNNQRRAGNWCKIKPGGPGNNRIGIADIKNCADACGSYFFAPKTMRFFKSRVSDVGFADGHGGAYFTTSEKGPDDVRRHSVRYYDSKRCNIKTIGEFQGYRSSASAKEAAKKLAVSKRTRSRSK